MIEVNGLSKRFGRLQALNDVDLLCQPGECVALIGPNACGKTTLIKCILGMVIPDRGTILFQSQSIAGQDEYRKAIGYMPQIGRYPDNMTIGQVIEMIREIRNRRDRYDEDLIDDFGLRAIADKKMRTLSGGTRQKVSAALAFLFDPDVLILDEPTAGLDPLAAELMKAKIRSANQRGKLVLITSHVLSELEDLVTHVVFMQEGQIRFHLSREALISQTRSASLAKAITHVLQHGHAT